MTEALKSKIKRLTRQQLIRVDRGLRGGVKPELEAVYQNIFNRDLAALSIEDTFYPLNSAANYSLLYLVLRSARELNIRSVVELGAGQTTILIDALRKKGVLKGSALTIEHDDAWAQRIGQLVSHPILNVRLVERQDGPYRYKGYDLSTLKTSAPIDLLLIDGPVAGDEERMHSRHGALPLLDRLDPEGFILILDDAERDGEAELVERVREYLLKKNIKFASGQSDAAKRQVLFATGRMMSSAFF
jgi:hypothetical protein